MITRKVRMEVTFEGREEVKVGIGYQEAAVLAGKILFLNLDGGYMGVYLIQLIKLIKQFIFLVWVSVSCIFIYMIKVKEKNVFCGPQ